MKQVYYTTNTTARQAACKSILAAPDNYRVEIRPRSRSIAQNDLLWSCLTDLSKQVQWSVNGNPERLSPEDWKDIMSASLHQEQRMAAGVRGGFVMLGKRTSRMTVAEMTELIEFIHVFGAEKDVVWSVTSVGRG